MACNLEHTFALPVAVVHAEALSLGGHPSAWVFYFVGYTALCSFCEPSPGSSCASWKNSEDFFRWVVVAFALRVLWRCFPLLAC
jgi:hypothetical protein